MSNFRKTNPVEMKEEFQVKPVRPEHSRQVPHDLETRLERLSTNLDKLLKHQRTLILMVERQAQRAIGNSLDWKKGAASLNSTEVDLFCDCSTEHLKGCHACRQLDQAQKTMAQFMLKAGELCEEQVRQRKDPCFAV